MKKLLKGIAILVGVLVLVVGAAAVLVPILVDPNDYKATIAEAVQERTGRTLAIDGNIGMTVFPWLGVDVGAIELGPGADQNGFESLAGAPFLRADSAQIRVKLMPLILSRRLEMDTVSASGLTLNLGRAADGRNNWDDLVNAGAEKGGASGGSSFGALALGGLDLRDAALRWHDAQAGGRYELSKVALRTGAIDLASPVRLAIEFDLDGTDQGLPPTLGGALRGHVKAAATVEIAPNTEVVVARDLDVDASLEGESGARARVKVSGGLGYDGPSSRIGAERLNVEISELDVEGSTGKISLAAGVDANLETRQFALVGIAASGEIAGAALDGGSAAFTLAGNADFDGAAQRLHVGDLALELPEFDVQGSQGRLSAKGALAGDLANLRLALTGLSASGALGGQALGAGTAEFRWSGDLNVDLGALSLSAPAFVLELPAFAIAGNAGALTAKGALDADLGARRYAIRQLVLGGALTQGPGFSGTVPLALRANVEADLGKDRIRATAVDLAAEGFDIEQASGDLRLRAAEITSGLSGAQLGAAKLAANGTVTGKAAFKGAVAFDVTGDGRVDTASGQLQFKPLVVKLPKFDVDGTSGVLVASGAVNADVARGVFTAGGLTAKGRVAGAALGGGSLAIDGGAADARFETSGQRFDVGGLDVKLGELEAEGVRGELRVTGNLVGSALESSYSGKKLRVRGRLEGTPIPGRTIDVDIAADAVANLKNETLRLTNLVAEAAGVRTEGTVDATGLLSGPRYAAALRIAPFQPRPLLERLGAGTIRTTDRAALASASAEAKITGGPDALALDDLTLVVDDTTVRGSLSVAGFARPKVRFDLVMNGIDADRYLAPADPNAKQPPRASGQPPPAVLPLALLTALDVDGQLKVGKLKINNLRVSNVRLTAKGAESQLDLNPAQANLYQGSYDGQMRIDARGAEPIVTGEHKLAGIQAGPLLTDLQGSAPVTGTTDFGLTFRTAGTTDAALRRNVDGQSRFSLRDGTLKGVDIVQTICSQLTGLGIVAARARSDAPAETRFSALGGTADIRKGVAVNQDLEMTSPFLRVTGSGKADLATEALDYSLVSHLVDSCEGQGRGVVENLVSIPIPVRVGGTLSAPTWGFDFERLLAALAGQQIQKQGTRILERALGGGRTQSAPSGGTQGKGSSTEDAVKGILKGLFK